MPDEKLPPKEPPAEPGPAWQVILEDIQSKVGVAIEAVQGFRSELKQENAQDREGARVQFDALKLAVRQNSSDIQALTGEVREFKGEVRKLQGNVGTLTDKVDNLPNVEERVSALERQRG